MAEQDPNVAPIVPAATPDPASPPVADEGLLELIKAQNDKIDELNAQIAAQVEAAKPPVDPADDPENAQPADWKSVRAEMKETSAKVTRETLEKIEADKQAAIEAEAEKRRKLDEQFDAQINEAQESGFLSPIVDKDNPEDPGLLERREMFAIAAKLGTPNLKGVAESMKKMHDKGLYYDYQKGEYVDRNAKVAPDPTRNGFTGQPVTPEASAFQTPNQPPVSPTGGQPTAPSGPGIQRTINNTPPPSAPVGGSGSGSGANRIVIPPDEFKNKSLDQLMAKYGK